MCENMSPLCHANQFLLLDDKSKNPNIDPLKLQKLLYYAYCFATVQFHVTLWDVDLYPIVKYSYGPYIRHVHSSYHGNVISSESRKRVATTQHQIDLVTSHSVIIEIIFKAFASYSGVTLMHMSHKEYPFKNVNFNQNMRLKDIELEFQLPEKSIMIWIEYLQFPVDKLIFNGHFYFFVQNMCEEDLREFCSRVETYPSIMNDPRKKDVIGMSLYPKCLLENYDPIVCLYYRPNVIVRIALSARFGCPQAQHDFMKIFHLFSIQEDDDPYTIVSERLLAKFKFPCIEIQNKPFDFSVISSSFLPVPGAEEFQQAQSTVSKTDRLALYQKACEKGYWRMSMVAAADEDLDIQTRKEYVQLGAANGLISACEMMCKPNYSKLFQFADDEKIRFLCQCAERYGDMKAYYLLGEFYRTSLHNEVEALHYYHMSYPFYGYSELLLAKYIEDNDSMLDEFFVDVLIRFFQDEEILAGTAFEKLKSQQQ